MAQAAEQWRQEQTVSKFLHNLIQVLGTEVTYVSTQVQFISNDITRSHHSMMWSCDIVAQYSRNHRKLSLNQSPS